MHAKQPAEPAATASAVAALPTSVAPPLSQPSDDEVRAAIMQQSRMGYYGSCPCPYNTDRAGRRCGGRSAYSRPGGASPICYPTDVTPQMIAAFRATQ